MGIEMDVAEQLLESYAKDDENYLQRHDVIFPCRETNFQELQLLREILFPAYWNAWSLTQPALLEEHIKRLKTQIELGAKATMDNYSSALVDSVLGELPNMREKLKTDIEAAFTGDPAAKSYIEIIRSYPGFNAMIVQRFAHLLYEREVFSYARELTEEIHSLTGIDIHPGASIGAYFFIDHGTGVVIGETAEIGEWVRMYQGVTLGTLHFLDEGDGILKKAYKRHPTIGNHVVIGAGAKLLGPMTVGNNVSIGANSWVSENVPDNTTKYIGKHPELREKANGNH